MALTVNEGTQTDVYSVVNGGTEIQVVKLDIGAGTTISDFGGTLPVVNNLTNGTVRVSVGTIATGTIQNLVTGTVDTVGLTHADKFGTVISTGTSTLGTIRAAVAGSVIYVTDLIISAGSATNVEIASGGTSTPIMGTAYLAANGGLVANFRTPLYTASGSALVYKQSTNGPLTISCLGYID